MYIKKFAPYIKSLPSSAPLTKKNLLVPQLQIGKEKHLEMYYAPHNDYINRKAQVVIAGITPGWTQMEMAHRQASLGLKNGASFENVTKRAKLAASFAGSMRKNLIEMLDACEINAVLGVDSSESFFSENRFLIHTTSVIKYPVFVKGKNYTGHTPKISASPLLHYYTNMVFLDELIQFPKALIIPLGKSVSDELITLGEQGKIDLNQCLLNFPHPSGVNGHRIKQFADRRDQLKITAANVLRS